MMKKRILALILMISVVFSMGMISSAVEKTKTIPAGGEENYITTTYNKKISQKITAKVTYIRYNGLPAGVFKASGTTCFVKNPSDTSVVAFGLNSTTQKSVSFYVQNTGLYKFGAHNNSDKTVELKIDSSFSNY